MDHNKIARAILAADCLGGIVGESHLASARSWPDWATHAVYYRDVFTGEGEEVGSRGRVRFFPSEAEYYSWVAASYRTIHALGGNVTRRVTTYEWDLGPGPLGTHDLY